MVTWFTENPIGVYLFLGAVAVLFTLIFFNTRRPAHLAGVLGCLALGAGVWLIDRLVVTDREQVQLRTLALAAAVERGDLSALEEIISADFDPPPTGKETLMARARRYFLPGRNRTVRFSQLGVARSNDPQRLTVRCNASASGHFGTFVVDPPYIGVTEFHFKKDADGRWRLTGFAVYGMGGEQINMPN
ncbi:MAG TPA: hypothetical protein PKD86_05390 [Gemmatales bacterium]|nr:hypothetical protein [Gemmatales bacterium]HMP58766.1 hypothetical protein [Gemmatales bacterium]